MLIMAESLVGASVKSLRVGGEVARVTGLLVDPRFLKVVAFYVEGGGIGFSPAVLVPEDVREIGPVGFIIDDADKIISPDDVVRLKEIIDFGFKLDGILVVDEKKRKVGRVEGYALDPAGCLVQQLYVKPGWMQSFNLAQVVVGRKQIKDISNEKIIVSVPEEKVRAEKKSAVSGAGEGFFENPFRKPEVANE